MIPTVLLPVAADSVAGACSSREELLHRATTSSMTAFHDNPITLANLCEVRSSGDADRFRLFSFDEGVQELASLKDAGGGLLVECSAAAEGRDPSGLAEISRRSGLGIVLGASCQQTNGTAQHKASPETISKELEHQLLFGEHGTSSAAASFAPSPAGAAVAESASAPARIQAGFLLVKLNTSCCSSPAAVRVETPAVTTTAGSPAHDTHGGLGRTAAIELEGAAMAQQATGAPLMIACSHFVRWPMVVAALVIATTHWGSSKDGTAAAAAAAAATTRKVIVAGMHGGVSQSLQHQASLLSKGIVLCFDCFGRVEWLPGPDYYPSDEESAVRIAELVRQGFADRIVLSSGVSRRFHLSRFGGYGYGHALRTVPPRLLRLGVSAKDIGLMTRDNMLGLLDWYTPPPPIEIPKDYLPCCWCKKRFEPVEGEYFHKFQFVYCNIKCLRAHRNTGFDADAAASK